MAKIMLRASLPETLSRKPSFADKFFVSHGARRKHGHKQTYSNSRQTNKAARRLEFGTIIVPPRKAIRRDKSDFLKFSDYTWSDVFVLLQLILA